MGQSFLWGIITESKNNFFELYSNKDVESPSTQTSISNENPLSSIDPFAQCTVTDVEMALRTHAWPIEYPSTMSAERINEEIGQYYKPNKIKTDDVIILPDTTGTAPVNSDNTIDQAPKNLPAVINNVSEHVEASVLSLFPGLKLCFTTEFYESVFSSDVDGLKNIFMDIQDHIRQSKIMMAVFIYRLHLEWELNAYEYNKRFGVNSLMEVIASLPEEYRMTRQNYNNYRMAGEVFVRYSLDSYEGVNNGTLIKREIIANLFSKNFSKLPYIYYWRYSNKRHQITLETLLYHLEKDDVREFKKFMRSNIIESKQKKPKDKKQNKALDEIQNDNVPAMPELTEEQRTIIQEMAKGKYVHLLKVASSDSRNFTAVKNALDAHYSKVNKLYRTTKVGILNYIESLGYFPINFVSLIKIIYFANNDGLEKKILPILVRECRTWTQKRIAQALIVLRFDNDIELGKDIYRREEKYLASSERAKKYLGIDEDEYKYLRRIGTGLFWLQTLKERGVDPLAKGTLDKLYHFGRAVAVCEQYPNDKEYAITKAVDAFKSLTVKEFRKFTKTGELPDIFSDKKRFWKVYKCAKPILEKLDQKRDNGFELHYLSLNSKADVKLVNEYNEDYKNGLLQ